MNVRIGLEEINRPRTVGEELESLQHHTAKIDMILREWDGTPQHAEAVLKRLTLWRRGFAMSPVVVKIPDS